MACYHLPSVRCSECAYGYTEFLPTGPSPYWPPVPSRTPYKCPVCEGTGKVALDFYSDEPGKLVLSPLPGICRTCYGSGVIWN